MADDDDGFALAFQLLEMLDHPALQGSHALAAGRARATAPLIPLPPLLIRREIGKRCAGPPTHVDLIEAGCDLHRAAAPICNDGRGLQRPSLRARLDHRRAILPEYLGRVSHLVT